MLTPLVEVRRIINRDRVGCVEYERNLRLFGAQLSVGQIAQYFPGCQGWNPCFYVFRMPQALFVP